MLRPTVSSRSSCIVTFSIILTIASVTSSINAATLLPGLFDTGLDDTGTPLSVGMNDPHYSLVSGPVLENWKASASNPSWLANTPTSQWLTPTGSGSDTHPSGMYSLQLTFDLVGYDPKNVSISGQWATDNVGEIYLNGSDTGISAPDEFLAWNPFTLSTGLVAGPNVIEFRVVNVDSAPPDPVGLRVEFTSIQAVPEPDSIGLLGICGIALLSRRRNQFRIVD
jgi:hypothetical protein